MRATRPRIPLLVLAGGILLLGVSMLIGNWHGWTPVSFPIDLRPGVSRSPLFSVSLTTDYLIELEVDRNLPFEQLNCLLGIDQGLAQDCRGTPSPVDIKWFVSSSGERVAEGTSQQERGGAWSTTVSRTIGRFRGEKGQEYLVLVESLKDASALAPANPRITVRVHPIESKGHYVLAQLIAWGGLAVVSIGLIWLLFAFFGQRKSE